MLSHIEIENRIKAGDLLVAYSFLPDGKGKFLFLGPESKVDPDDTTSEATRFFKKRLFSDRLGITLGPIIESHNPEFFRKRPSFKGREDQADLRDSNGQLTLYPYESISVASNERIRLSAKLGCLVTPRLSHVDSGIVLNVTYVDPYWDGVLQMVITNATPRKQTLSLGEAIGQCFFFDIQGGVDPGFESEFARKSHHFANNWEKILQTDVDAFPKRKRPILDSGLSSLVNRASRFWAVYGDSFKRFGISAIGVGTVFGAGTLWIRFKTLEESVSKIPAITQQVTRIENGIPARHQFQLHFAAGQKNASASFDLGANWSPNAIHVVEIGDSLPIVNVRSSLRQAVSSKSAELQVSLTFDSIPAADGNILIKVLYYQ